MRKIFFFILISLIPFIFSCSDGTKSESDTATISGVVYGLDNDQILAPLSNALISAQGYLVQTTSNINGEYQLNLELEDDLPNTISIRASKAGYIYDLAEVSAQNGYTVQAPDITLRSLADTTEITTPGESGDAAHIEVNGFHQQHIYVMGAGLQETAKINFIVKDADGVPVDEEHSVLVHFSIIGGPGGGELVSPDTMTTSSGLCYTVLNSGIKAGAVQLKATASVNGNTISTIPVRIVIYGGLPDDAHFSLSANRVNIAGLRFLGLLDNITAFVGDKYSNPVAPGTVVYFSSDYGIVDGSSETDEMGRATVRFMTAAPLPPNPEDSAFVHITGWTYNDINTENLISTKTRVLLTDNTAPITIMPTTFTYNNSNIPIDFVYTVSDIWGRPLVADSKIQVLSTDGQLLGDTDVITEDTQGFGPGTTFFNFTWTPGDSLDAPEVAISIKVTTPSDGNGYQSARIVGSKGSN